MGELTETLSAFCNGQIRPGPCRHEWLVCLSECRQKILNTYRPSYYCFWFPFKPILVASARVGYTHTVPCRRTFGSGPRSRSTICTHVWAKIYNLGKPAHFPAFPPIFRTILIFQTCIFVNFKLLYILELRVGLAAVFLLYIRNFLANNHKQNNTHITFHKTLRVKTNCPGL